MADKEQGMGEEAARRGRSTRFGGASPTNDVDDLALEGGRTEWQEGSQPAAGDPLSDRERDGLSILGGSNVRDGSIPGVSDPIRDGSGGPRERPDAEQGISATGGRKNPPLMEGADAGDGGISASGGVAGGARGHGGRSDAGAGAPDADAGVNPAQHRSTSRTDLDHPSSDVGERGR